MKQKSKASRGAAMRRILILITTMKPLAVRALAAWVDTMPIWSEYKNPLCRSSWHASYCTHSYIHTCTHHHSGMCMYLFICSVGFAFQCEYLTRIKMWLVQNVAFFRRILNLSKHDLWIFIALHLKGNCQKYGDLRLRGHAVSQTTRRGIFSVVLNAKAFMPESSCTLRIS